MQRKTVTPQCISRVGFKAYILFFTSYRSSHLYIKHLEELKSSTKNHFNKAVSSVITITTANEVVSSPTAISAAEIKTTTTKTVSINLSHTITAEKLENTSTVKSSINTPSNQHVENFPFQRMKHHFQPMNHRVFDLPMYRGGYWYAVGCLGRSQL